MVIVSVLRSAPKQVSCPKTRHKTAVPGEREKEKYYSLTITFSKSVIFTYYQAHDIMTITASLNILKSLLTHQSRKARVSPRILTPSPDGSIGLTTRTHIFPFRCNLPPYPFRNQKQRNQSPKQSPKSPLHYRTWR